MPFSLIRQPFLKLYIIKTISAIHAKCFHCGENCEDTVIADKEKEFCCEGCHQVYLLLNENNLCVYYDLDKSPGIKAKGKFTQERFAYLDDETTIEQIAQFKSDTQINVTFSLPQIHCSSCIFLLENLHRINPAIIKSQTNFHRKEVFVVFNPQQISLRKVVELLAFIGYEPAISLKDTVKKKQNKFNKERVYKIGVAGFCFTNIMMLSFPEYFSSGKINEAVLKITFSWLNLFLSLPVLFYCASVFFISAWKGLQQRFLNIDLPIALAITVTFSRSYYEIITGHGAGYLDSGSGIVFFMLIGRWFQDKTYDSLSFDRDYKSYFPLGVTAIKNGIEKNIPVTQLLQGDRIIIRNEEMIPADALLVDGKAHIDYSFVSGENDPVQKGEGDLIYAGGRQMGGAIILKVAGNVSQNYITQLWNNEIFHNKKNRERSFIHPWSRYFTLSLFVIAIGTLLFWWIYDTSKILPAVSSVLIVACPCSLLLSATFTYGNMLRIFGKNKMYLKNSGVIESLAKVNSIVFDKTGTITQSHLSSVNYVGTPLTEKELVATKQLAVQSSHPLSKLIAEWLLIRDEKKLPVQDFKEYKGQGLTGKVDNTCIKMGSADFISQFNKGFIIYDSGTNVHIMANKTYMGHFEISNRYRQGIQELIQSLKEKKIKLALLSGDNDAEKENLKSLFGKEVPMQFKQSPQEKLEYIQLLQQKDQTVLMLGDGLNDAGALMQADVGVAISDNSTRFSPASDAILDGSNVHLFDKFISFAKSGKTIVMASFILSILYNIVGLSFAVQGLLSPMIAAILMPVSSISIVLLVTVLSSCSARFKGLK